MEMSRSGTDMMSPKIRVGTRNWEGSEKTITDRLPEDRVVCTPHQAAQPLGPALEGHFENQ